MPAIANAVYDAVGVRIDEVPITPDKVLKALEAKAAGRLPRYGPSSFPDVDVAGAPRCSAALGGRRWPLDEPGRTHGERESVPSKAGAAMMRLPRFEYCSPRTVAEAAARLAAAPSDSMLLAGGTDLLPNMKRRQQTPRAIIAFRGIPELSTSIMARRRSGRGRDARDARGRSGIRSEHTALWQATRQIATPQLRNMGTIGGNLCLDTRCTYYDQNYEWRKAIDFCMKKDGDDLLGCAWKPCVSGGFLHRHRSRPLGAWRDSPARLGAR